MPIKWKCHPNVPYTVSLKMVPHLIFFGRGRKRLKYFTPIRPLAILYRSELSKSRGLPLYQQILFKNGNFEINSKTEIFITAAPPVILHQIGIIFTYYYFLLDHSVLCWNEKLHDCACHLYFFFNNKILLSPKDTYSDRLTFNCSKMS